MKNHVRKLLLIGMDGASYEIVTEFVKKGVLPNIARLIEAGVISPIHSAFPTVTPPNWTTIVTGAWPVSHGITDFWLHEAGQPLDQLQLGFDTTKCRCEYLWDAAERGGRRSILVKFEASWPPTHKTGIQVEGLGPGGTSHFEISGGKLFTLEDWPLVTTVKLQPATAWQHLPPTSVPPLESKLVITPLVGEVAKGRVGSAVSVRTPYKRGAPKEFELLILASGNAGYDRAIVCRSKDCGSAIAELSVGEWSPWVRERFEIDDGVDGIVRFKLMKLAADASELEIYMPQVFPVAGYIQPPELAEELYREVGPFLQNPGRTEFERGWIPDETFMELIEYQNAWLGRATQWLCTHHPWDLCFVQTHTPDYLSHYYLTDLDPVSKRPRERRENAERQVARALRSVDQFVGDAMAVADEDTLIVLVSDHGGTASPVGHHSVNRVLAEAGLLAYRHDPATGLEVIDWSRTKAVKQRSIHVYVNLRGRDPAGIVPPEEYDEVRQHVIDAMMTYRDPETQKRVYAMAIRREEALSLGQGSSGSGDVIFAVNSEFDENHGGQLPGRRFGKYSLRAVLIMAGPGIKRGHHLNRVAFTTDIVPTVVHLMRLPVPRGCEGAVLYEALEDPDAVIKELARAREESERWRKAYDAYRKLTHLE